MTCQYSPDNQQILMTLRPRMNERSIGSKAQVWNAHSGRAVLMIEEPKQGITTATYSPDGKEIWTLGSLGIDLHRWDAKQGIRTWVWQTHSSF